MCNMKNKPPGHGRIFFSNSSNNCVTKQSDILMCKMKLRRNNNKKRKKNQQVDAFYRTQRSGNSGIFHLCKGFLFLLAAA